MSAAQEREARLYVDDVLVALPENGAQRIRATQAARQTKRVFARFVGRDRMVDFILDILEKDGLAENRGGWWRRTSKGDKHVRNRG